jgi:hypothetical protein
MGVRGAAVAILFVAACAAGGPVAEEQAASELAFETVLDETFSGLEEGLREVVRDEDRWAELWGQIHRTVSPRPPLPAVDFSREMLIAAAAGTRRSSGFDIVVRGVTLREGQIEVEILETCPEPGGMAGMALTQPVEVVRLARLPQTPVFRETKAPSCE